jgi:hypothetical protein
MKRIFTMTGNILLILLATSSLLAGCSPATPTATPIPTIGQETLMAAAVKTVSAEITEEARRNPSPTPPPTATPVPPTPTLAPPTDTPVPTIPPTETQTLAPALSAHFLYAATYPENKRQYIPNEKFGLALGFQNTGTVTWEPGYRLKIASFKGEITVQQEIELGQAIAPGAKVEFNLWAFGSETLGDHVWVFQLYSSQGVPVPGGVAVYSYKSV